MTENSGNDNPTQPEREQLSGSPSPVNRPNNASANSPPAAPASPNPAGMRKTQPVEARTALDLDACREVAAKKVAEKEQQVQDRSFQSAPSVEAVKPFQAIENFRPASPCSAAWEQMEGTARVRFCKRCQHQVYDFNSVELPEAEETIFKMEAKKDVTLYKRNDGRFLTSDCPVGAKAAQTRLLAIVGGALLVVALIAVAIMTPHPEPVPAPVQSNADNAAGTARTPANSTGSAARTGSNPQAARPASRTIRVYMEDGSPATLPSPLIQNPAPAAQPTLSPVQTTASPANPPAQPAQTGAAPLPSGAGQSAASETPPATEPNQQPPSAPAGADGSSPSPPRANSPYIWEKH